MFVCMYEAAIKAFPFQLIKMKLKHFITIFSGSSWTLFFQNGLSVALPVQKLGQKNTLIHHNFFFFQTIALCVGIHVPLTFLQK
jgi:hypothetical protein